MRSFRIGPTAWWPFTRRLSLKFTPVNAVSRGGHRMQRLPGMWKIRDHVAVGARIYVMGLATREPGNGHSLGHA